MIRRTSLLAVAGCLLLAGCGGVISDDPRRTASPTEPGQGLAVDAPTIAPGETGSLSIEATNVSSLRVRTIASDAVTVDYGNTSHSPTPETTWITYPPSWSWSWNGTNVTTTLPVVASENAARGTYEVGIDIRIDGENRNETAVVTVE